MILIHHYVFLLKGHYQLSTLQTKYWCNCHHNIHGKHFYLNCPKLSCQVAKRNTDNTSLHSVHPALRCAENRMEPKTGLQSNNYAVTMSKQLRDGITDILAWTVLSKGILSLLFSHQQTWLQRRSTYFGRESTQGPFSPDIYICSPPLTDLQALNQFKCGLEGTHQFSDF